MRWILAVLLLLVPSLLWADPPKVEPSKIEVEARELFQFSVVAEKGKKLVAGKLPADKFVVFPLPDGSFVGQSRKGVQGTFVLQFWHEGDTVKLPGAAPLPSLPVATLTVVVGEPIPEPKPDPRPDPKPDPKVIPTDVLRVLIVEESAERSTLPAGKLTAMFAESVHRYVKDQSGYLRVYDKDADISKEHEFFRKAFALPRESLPWLIVGNGKKQYVGPLPASHVPMLELLKQYGE